MADSAVNLGAGSPDFSGMSMNEAFGFEPGDPGYVGQFPGRIYKEGEAMSEPYFLSEEYKFEVEGPRTTDLYEGMAPPLMDQGLGSMPSIPAKQYLQDGGEVEEAGILGALFSSDIDLPDSADQNLVRTSAREGSEGAAMYYPEGAPTFEQILEERYGYPDAEREVYGATTSEAMRAARPRHDMPTYQELEDARAHVLQSALLAKQVGPETAEAFGGLSEMFDRYMPILGTATDADVVMDKRNNAFGAKLLKEAGINATPQEITQMVDQKIFDQLDVVLGREKGERRFKSPDTGIDIFFPRDKYGYFDVNRYD